MPVLLFGALFGKAFGRGVLFGLMGGPVQSSERTIPDHRGGQPPPAWANSVLSGRRPSEIMAYPLPALRSFNAPPIYQHIKNGPEQYAQTRFFLLLVSITAK